MTDNPVFYDSDAEKAIIGAVLIDNSCIQDVRDELIASDFYNSTNAQLWGMIVDMNDKRIPVDMISLTDTIRTRGITIDPLYLSDLTHGAAVGDFSVAFLSRYISIVKDKSLKRRLWRTNVGCADELKRGQKSGKDIALDLEKMASDIASNTVVGDYVKMGSLVPGTVQRIEHITKHPDELDGLSLGLDSVDAITNGIKDTDYVIIGARPSCGKSSLLLTMANNMTIDRKIPVGIFSCEMSKESLNRRQVYGLSGLSEKRLKFGHLAPRAMQQLEEACTKVYNAPMYIDDTPNISLSAFRASARKMIRQDGVKAIFIDYLGLMNAENPKLARWERIGILSKSLKTFCRENHVPLIVLSQLSREAQGKKPSLAELRDSGAVEEDADVVFFLHREKEPDINAEVIETELICAKQRNGPVGTIKLNFYPALTKFEDIKTN